MRVQIKTTPGAIFGRLILFFLIGVIVTLWAFHRNGLDFSTGKPVGQPPVAPQPSVSAQPVAAPKPSAAPSPSGIDLMGIHIPAPGSNDPHP
jgi:hypothetical protein